ncbi:MAG: DUF3991 domain-containing protein [Thermoplasmata archaeon]
MLDANLIIKARDVDLLTYLRSNGYNLKKSGRNEYRLVEHDSLVISNNKWFWFSKNIGGNTLDFLIKYEGKKLTEAVKILLGEYEVSSQQKRCIEQKPKQDNDNITDKELKLPEKNTNYRRLFAYLNKTRLIDRDIITDMIKNKKIYESDQHNCVFLGTDKDGVVRFASERGTLSEVSYKKDCPGSDKRYGFLMEGKSDTVYVFESAIDALSHASLIKLQKLDYKKDWRLSLGGVSDIALETFLTERQGIKNIVLCLDNDTAGKDAAERIYKKYNEKGYKVEFSFPKNKDFNEDLINFFKGRVISYAR